MAQPCTQVSLQDWLGVCRHTQMLAQTERVETMVTAPEIDNVDLASPYSAVDKEKSQEDTVNGSPSPHLYQATKQLYHETPLS